MATAIARGRRIRTGAGDTRSRVAYAVHFTGGNTGVMGLPTSNGDVWTTVIMPSDGWIEHSTVHISNPGTGTDNPTIQWFPQANGAGTALTTPYAHTDGTLYDYDGAVSLDFACDGDVRGSTQQPEGKQLFMNIQFGGGTHTAGGSQEWSLWLLL